MRISCFNPNPKTYDLHLTIYGNEDCVDGFVCPTHTRPYYLIHYIIRGEGFLHTEQGDFKASEGQIFVIYPGIPVSYDSPDPTKTWSFCWIGFDGDRADFYAKEAGLSPENPVITLHSSRFMTTILNLIAESQQTVLPELQMYAALLNALASIRNGTAEPKKVPYYTETAISFIENHYMKRISVQDIAEHVGLERSYFYRIFKKDTRTAPEQFLRHYRLDRASELLRSSHYNIEQIALLCGFRDVFYFSRAFKQQFGKSPTSYRKNHEN